MGDCQGSQLISFLGVDYCTNIWIFIAFPVWLQENISIPEEGIYPLLPSQLVSYRNLSVKSQLRYNLTPTGRPQHTYGPITFLVGSVGLMLLPSSSSSGVLPHCDRIFFPEMIPKHSTCSRYVTNASCCFLLIRRKQAREPGNILL